MIKNTSNRKNAANILRAYLDARRECQAENFHLLPATFQTETKQMLQDSLRQFLKLQDEMMAVTGANFTVNGETVKAAVVNPGDWFGKAWLISMPLGNFAAHYIVEADHVSDALDEFSESEKFGHLIRAEANEVSEHSEDENNPTFEREGKIYQYAEGTSFDGTGQPYDTDELNIEGREGKALPFVCKYESEGLPDLTPTKYYERYNNRGLSRFIRAEGFPF